MDARVSRDAQTLQAMGNTDSYKYSPKVQMHRSARENVDIIQLWDLLWRGDQFALFWISIGRVRRVTWSWAFFWNIYKLLFWDLEVFLGPIALIAAEKIYWKDEVLVDCAAKNSKECHNFISKWNEDYGRLSPYLMYKCQTVLCEISW